MTFLALGAMVLALLIWAGREPRRVSGQVRLACALFAALAAAGAVVSGLRGSWIGSLVLLGASAYLGRRARAGARARRGSTGPSSPSRGGLSVSEARTILGVGADAGRPEIEAAYRRLMQRAHPDRGGTSGLAAQLNAARDRLKP